VYTFVCVSNHSLRIYWRLVGFLTSKRFNCRLSVHKWFWYYAHKCVELTGLQSSEYWQRKGFLVWNNNADSMVLTMKILWRPVANGRSTLTYIMSEQETSFTDYSSGGNVTDVSDNVNGNDKHAGSSSSKVDSAFDYNSLSKLLSDRSKSKKRSIRVTM